MDAKNHLERCDRAVRAEDANDKSRMFSALDRMEQSAMRRQAEPTDRLTALTAVPTAEVKVTAATAAAAAAAASLKHAVKLSAPVCVQACELGPEQRDAIRQKLLSALSERWPTMDANLARQFARHQEGQCLAGSRTKRDYMDAARAALRALREAASVDALVAPMLLDEESLAKPAEPAQPAPTAPVPQVGSVTASPAGEATSARVEPKPHESQPAVAPAAPAPAAPAAPPKKMRFFFEKQ